MVSKNKQMISSRYIVITRPTTESTVFKKKLEEAGFSVISCPGISIHKSHLSVLQKNALKNIASFAWIVFTSRNGVSYFLQRLAELGIDPRVLQKIRVAAVGSATAERLKKYHIHIDFIPSEFTTEQLGEQIPDIFGKKALLPRANIASKVLVKTLQERGADVTEIPMYTTSLVLQTYTELETLIRQNAIYALTFTSPSTVRGFVKNLTDPEIVKKARSLPVFSIGPVTTKTLEQLGFENVFTAPVHTIEGLLNVIKASSL